MSGHSFDQFDTEEPAVLQDVKMWSHVTTPNWPGRIVLDFGRFSVSIRVEADNDTLVLRRADELLDAEHTVPLRSDFWEPLIGWTLANAWQMTSDRGHTDAVQLRFREHVASGPYATVQFWAVCSSIELVELVSARAYPQPGTPAD